jgi:hypothetical protein
VFELDCDDDEPPGFTTRVPLFGPWGRLPASEGLSGWNVAGSVGFNGGLI